MRLIAKSLRPHGPSIAHSRQRTVPRQLPHYLRFASFLWYCSPNENPSIPRFFAETWTHTKDPIWVFVNRLKRHRNSASLTRTLRREDMTWSEYLKWENLAGPRAADSVFAQPQVPPMDVPGWALVRLITRRTWTPTHAQAICETALSQISTAPPGLIPSLLILCVHVLANHQMLGPLRLVVSKFRQIPPPIPYFHYHLLLKAISGFRSSLEVSRLITIILEDMVDNEFRIKSPTYAALLNSPARTATLARHLRKLMISQGTMPTTEIFYAFFRIFAKRGSTQVASTYLMNNFPTSPYTVSHPAEPSRPRSKIRLRRFIRSSDGHTAKCLDLLNSFGNPAAAFRYLDLISKVNGPRVLHSLDIRGWTSILSLAARGNNVSSDDLLNLFSQIKDKYKPTAVTYTILIRALLNRKSYNDAINIWNEFVDSRVALDIKSLSAGAEAFTLAGKPLQAFHLLERYAVKPRTNRSPSPHTQIALSPPFINVFMENLLRINRPDVVFALWDHAETLYRVMPDCGTLNILLSTARIVGKYDETLPGFWAHFRAQVSTTLHSNTSFSVASRSEAVQIFELMLDNRESHGKNKALTGMWNDTPAWQKATRIFCHAVLGNSPRLLQIAAPVTPLRSSVDDMGRHPLKELARNILGPPHDDPFHQDVPPDLGSPAALARLGLYPLGAYPKIFPTKITFHNYIYLLGLNNQAAQIPLALAWMKELGILPMKRTVAMALVFWAEVSLRAPLLEQWMGEGEYAKFVRWIEAWIGLDNMPGQSRMTKSSKIIARAREGFDFIN